MKFDSFAVCVASCFVCAIEYGDDSGLSTHESRQLEAYLTGLNEQAANAGATGPGHWSWANESEDFARCEVTGLHAECARGEYLFPVPEKC